MKLRYFLTLLKDCRQLRFLMLTSRFWYYIFKQRKAIRGAFAGPERKSIWRIIAEVFASWRYWRMFPFHYFRYRLYGTTPERTRAEILEYVPEFYLDHIHIPRVNDMAYKAVMKDKILTAKVLALKPAITHPRILFWCEDGIVFDPSANTICENEFPRVLHACKNAIFFKPTGGRGGAGIEVFEPKGEGAFESANGQVLDWEYLISTSANDDYIAEEGAEQIELLNKIYPDSINTIRIASKIKKGKVNLVAAILRVGRGGNRVDNSARGGISINIDLETWRLAETAYSEHPVASYTEHPDTKSPFGQHLPMKEETLQLLEETTRLFPKCEIVGWDICLTPEGPMLIEVNPGFGIDHVQLTCQRGIARDLGLMKDQRIKNDN